MRPSYFSSLSRNLCLALFLVLAQGFLVAHAAEHPAGALEHHDCELCVHAQGLDDAAVAASPASVEPPASAPCIGASPLLLADAARAAVRIRGPPA